MSPALAGRFFTTSATWEAQNRRLPYSPSQRNSNLVWVFPEADPRQGSGGKKYTWEMKENIGRRGRQGREAGWWRGLLSGFILEFNFAGETVQFSSVQLLSHVRLFATPWTAARQASLSITNSWSLPKLMSIESLFWLSLKWTWTLTGNSPQPLLVKWKGGSLGKSRY